MTNIEIKLIYQKILCVVYTLKKAFHTLSYKVSLNSLFFATFMLYVIGGIFLSRQFDSLLKGNGNKVLLFTSLILYAYAFVYKKTNKWWRLSFFVLCLFLFYLANSFLIHSNIAHAIIVDFLWQLNTYLAFFCVMQISPDLSRYKLTIKQIILWFLLPILLIRISGIPILSFGHPGGIGYCSILSALLYLFASNGRKIDKIVFCTIICLVIFADSSRQLGFISFAMFYIIFIPKFNLTISLKNIFFVLLFLGGITLIGYEEFLNYFIEGSKTMEHFSPRPALYLGMILVLQKYFFFGSGLVSYATPPSAFNYAPLYTEIGFNELEAFNPKNDLLYLGDSFYPSLAQFGVIGIILFIAYWFYIIKESNRYANEYGKKILKNYQCIVMILVFLLIDMPFAGGFTGERGFIFMSLLALCLTELKKQSKIQGVKK